jgi:hypothetical protein
MGGKGTPSWLGYEMLKEALKFDQMWSWSDSLDCLHLLSVPKVLPQLTQHQNQSVSHPENCNNDQKLMILVLAIDRSLEVPIIPLLATLLSSFSSFSVCSLSTPSTSTSNNIVLLSDYGFSISMIT